MALIQQAQQAQAAAAAAAAAAATPVPPAQPARNTEDGGILEVSTDVFASYAPSIQVGLPHPSKCVESGLLAAVQLPELGYDAEGLPSDTVSGGKLSSLQIESVMAAGHRHRLLIGGSRAGFFLGDGTGVGKGRQLAGIILDNIARKRKVHCWITTSPDLKDEAANDFKDIGAPSVLVKGLEDLDKAQGPLGLSEDFRNPAGGLVLFISYSSLIGSKRGGGAGNKVKRTEQLIKFLGGEAFDGVICFDEAHKAKAYNIDKPEASSQMSKAVIELQTRMPKARIIYSSATGIESLTQMGYAERLFLWGNPSFDTFKTFQDKFMKRGVQSLELLAVEMKLAASFIARSLSWEGAQFDLVEMPISESQERLYNELSAFFFRLRDACRKAQSICGSSCPNNPVKMFWSLQQRFFRDAINSMKLDGPMGIVEETERALRGGYCVVIGLQSTGEAALHGILEEAGAKAITKLGNKVHVDEMASGPKEGLLGFLHKHFPVEKPYQSPEIPEIGYFQDMARIFQAKGMSYDLAAKLKEREDMIKADAEADKTPQKVESLVHLRQSLIDEVQAMQIPPSPLDALIDRLGGPDKVAEMTGRSGRLVRRVYTDGQEGFEYQSRNHGHKQKNALHTEAVDSVNIEERKAFMQGKKLIAIISDAASTGISLHASLNASKNNQRRRVHITLELSFSADKTLQQLGRSHRSHQSSAPIYKLLTTSLGGERRFASSVAKRLSSLGALTRGDRRASTIIDFSDFQLETRQGGIALRKLLSRLENSVDDSSDVPNLVGDVNVPGLDLTNGEAIRQVAAAALEDIGMYDAQSQATVSRFLNRILMLPEGKQNLLFNLFTAHLSSVIADQRAQGTYDDGVVDLRASTIVQQGPAVVVWEDRATNAKCESVPLELDRGVTFEDAMEVYNKQLEEDPESEVAFWESRKEHFSRKLYLLAVPKLTVEGLVYITRPNTGRNPVEMETIDLRNNYRKVEPQDAEEGWTSIYKATEDQCIHGDNCKVAQCTQGGRKQHVCLITGTVVPIWNALESTVITHRSELTRIEAQLRVVRVTLSDDGQRRVVGVRFPTQPHILSTLITKTKELISKHQINSVVEPVTPVDSTVMKKATTAKRTLTSFFKPTGASSSSSSDNKKPKLK